VSQLALYLLGPPRVELDGEEIHVSRRRAMALLAYLAVTGRTHSRDSLAALLWPEYDQSSARADLRRTLSLLNRTLGEDCLTIDRETAGLNPDADLWLDVDQFRQRLAAGEGHGHPSTEVSPDCLPLLEEAVALYQDDFLSGFTLRDSASFDEWQFFQTEGLRDELASTLERLVRHHSAQGERGYERAIGYARRRLALDPLHEPAHRELMQLYAQVGQRSAALRQYEECVRILREELGLPPSQETTSLYERIRAGPADLGERGLAAARPRHNLPAQSTPFIGRESELAAIEARLSDPDCRLLTLVGPGGSGKTRLALEAAASQLDGFEHGVFFVSLASLQSADGIVPTVARCLDLHFHSGARAGSQPILRQQLLDYLRRKKMLFVLDSLEHLLALCIPSTNREDEKIEATPRAGEGAVELVTQILETAPEVRLLVTSRARLNLRSEYLFAVSGMDHPGRQATRDAAQYSAVRLFLDSARRVRPDIELREDALADVVQICRLVEGMPLGIVLAAAWTEILSPAEIAAEIERGLDFLEVDLRDLPRRQRSMRAVFDQSWHLLTDQERDAFQGLSVFRGGFTREAAQMVTGASLRTLLALVSKSLVQRTDAGRFEVHELLRQYAAERLGRSPAANAAARDRHCAYYAAALQQWVEDLNDPRQRTALAAMDVEIENARIAWDWAVEQMQVERLGQALEGLCLYYERRERHQEGETACREAAEKLATVTSNKELQVLARILRRQSYFEYALFRHQLAHGLAQQSLDLLERLELASQDVRVEKASALGTMGWRVFRLALGAGTVEANYEKVKQLWEQSLALHRAVDDRRGTSDALANLAFLASWTGDYDKARGMLEDSLALRRHLGDQWGAAASLTELGRLSWIRGQLEDAERFLRESLNLYQEADDQFSIEDTLVYLGEVLYRRGEFAEGCSAIQQSLAIRDYLESRAYWGGSHLFLCEAKVHLGEYVQARAWGQEGLALVQEFDFAWGIGFAHFVLGLVALGEAAYAEARRSLEESVIIFRGIELHDNLAWALGALAYAVRGLSRLPEAEQYLSEALQIYSEAGVFFASMYGLPAAALLLADQGETERAVELYALASRYPFVANSRWFEDVAGKHIAAVAATLPLDVVAAAQERGRARNLDATVAELLDEVEG
jgi:predicted ATPase/DNA-binding SARP family transcriptional activator